MPVIAHDGAIIFDLLIAGVLTLIVGALALIRLQSAIKANMAVAGIFRRTDATLVEPVRQPGARALSLAVDEGAASTASEADRVLRRAILAHIAAGAVFAVLATVLLFWISGTEFLPLRTTVVFWAYAWPTSLVLQLMVGPDRRAQGLILLAYFGGLIALCALTSLSPTQAMAIGGVSVPAFFQPLLLWTIYAAPSLFLLLFLNRTIRTIGPLVLVFAFVVMLGNHVAITMLSFPVVLTFVVNVAIAIGLGGQAFWGFSFLCMAVAALPAWLVVAFLRDRYAAKKMSEFQFTVSAVWILQALMLSFSLLREGGFLAASGAFIPLLGWRLTLGLMLRPLAASARTRPAQTLLLLRVYGFGRRSRRLFDLLGARCRLLGSIDLIAAPDLASRTIEPATFLEFIRGRIKRLFVRTPQDLEERLAAIDRLPDPDARFRVNQLFCSDDMWKEAVTRLMESATLVVMDLRGFSSQRAGCVFEIQTLLDVVPLERLVFLFDQSTHRDELKAVLADRWRQLDATSPNLAATTPTLRLLDAGVGAADAVHRLLTLARAQSPSAVRRAEAVRRVSQ